MEASRLLEVLKALSDAGVEYKVVGAVALNLHGIVRATEDRADAERLRQQFNLEDG